MNKYDKRIEQLKEKKDIRDVVKKETKGINIRTIPKDFNPIPIRKNSKIPIGKWKRYITEAFPHERLKNHDGNIAVHCGKISNNLLILDWDFKEGHKYSFETLYQKFLEAFPELGDTYIVSTPHGFHFYYRMVDFLEKKSGNTNRIFDKKGKIFSGVIKTEYYEHLKGWDVLGQGGYILCPPSQLYELEYINKNGVRIREYEYKVKREEVKEIVNKTLLKYEPHNNKKIRPINSKQLEKVKQFFLLDKVKKPRKSFIDIMNGVIEIETYAIETGQPEFIYWKYLFREMWHYCGMEPHEVYRFLEMNQPAYKKDVCDTQLQHYPYTDNPLTTESMKKYFPTYYTSKIIIDDTGITLSDLPTNNNQNNNQNTNQNDDLSKYEIRDIISENIDIKVIIENGEFVLYKDGIYIRDQKRRVKSIVKNYLEELEIPYTFAYLRDLVELLENDDTLVNIEEFDKNPYILNLNNGLLDVKTLELRKHIPKHLSFRRIPIDYDKNAKCPNIEKFIEDVFKKEDIPLIYEMTGLCLTPDMDFQKAFLLYGSGNNGKTTFFNLLIVLINKKNCSDVDLIQLQNPFLYSQLENKLLNIVSDVDSSTKLKIQIFKNYVGNASFITVNKKNKSIYHTIPTAKLLYSCNTTFPQIPLDTDKGFFRKWITIECPNDFDGIEDIKIFERLSTDTELSGLLNKSIEGLKRLIKRERFNDKYNNWEEVKDLWFLKINDFAEFIEKEAEVDYKFIADKTYTLKKFNEYLIEKGKKPVSKTMVTKFINESPNYHTNRSNIKGKRTPHYIGFRLKGDPINRKDGNIQGFM